MPLDHSAVTSPSIYIIYNNVGRTLNVVIHKAIGAQMKVSKYMFPGFLIISGKGRGKGGGV